MTQQRLDRAQVHSALKKMGGKTMPQRVNAFAFFNATFLLGSIVDFLDCGDIQRAISVLAKKDPPNRLISLLVSLQLTEQPLGENRVTVFFPLPCSTRIIIRSVWISLSLRWTSSLTRSPAE